MDMILSESTLALSRYVRGQTAVCLVAGIMHTVFFAIVGLPYALIIGILAGLAEAVPFLGSLVVVVTVAVVGLASEPRVGMLALAYYLIIGNQVANYIITPRLMSKNLDIHPFVIIMAVLVGSSLGGAVGALLALPAAVVLQTLALRLWGKPKTDELATANDTP